MKKPIFLFCITCFGFSACQNNQKAQVKESLNVAPPVNISNQGESPVMKFAENSKDFGKITEGDSIVYVYKFTNVGGKDLVINHASASCGCTVPEWPKEPIKPNEKGEIKVVFRSINKKGMQNKTVSVYANTKPEVNSISFQVEVLPKPGQMNN